MLKVTDDADERHGHLLMRWWAADGAARVLAYDDGAVLLERATGSRSLVRLAERRSGRRRPPGSSATSPAGCTPRGEPLPPVWCR